MEFTKSTVIVWGNREDQRHEALYAAREAKLLEMEAAGKTEASAKELVDWVTTKRHWKDQSSAEEFVTFILELAALHNCSIVSTQIEDYVAPPV